MMRQRHPASFCVVVGLISAAYLLPGPSVAADEAPLHVQIDQLLAGSLQSPPLQLAGDAEFLRRVSLHLTGMPPTPDELRAFLADTNPDKRTAAVDRLLDSPQYVRHLAEVLDVMLMERRANTNVTQDEWMAYLVQSVRANKPWNQLVREILSADGTDEDPRAAARFYLDRGSEPNLLTRDVGRIFFGRDLQCAQCHDHPLIDDYLQSDYHGLLAFFSPGFELKIKEGDKERAYYAERAGADVQFESVFVKGTRHVTGPRLPGDVEIVEPAFLPGEEYEVAPAEAVRPVPKFSRRAKLVELATSGQNRAFNENIANRLWAMMMGRGLVHPVDLHHSSNPPSHPELLALLGRQFAAMNFDMRAFLRELALTQNYQRALDLPAEYLGSADAIAATLPELEQQREARMAEAEAAIAAFSAAVEKWNTAEAALLPALAELDAARAKYTDLRKKLDEARKAAADAENQSVAKQKVSATVKEAADKAQAAAAALPEDKELAAAAQKFAERAAQLASEAEALAKTAAEKAAGATAAQAEFDAARPAVETAQQKVEPLREAVRTQEQAVLAARSDMTAKVTALNAHDEQIHTVRTYAEFAKANAAALGAAEAVRAREAEHSQAAAQAAEFVAVLDGERAKQKAAEQAVAAADEALKTVKAEYDRRAEAAQSVADAAAAAASALAKVPGDESVKQASEALLARSEALQADLQAYQSQLESAKAAHATQTSALAEAAAAVQQAEQQEARLDEQVKAAEAALQAARTEAEAARAVVAGAENAVSERLIRSFQLADLQPLSPEELCWSVFRVTGVYDRYWQAQAAELDKAQPLSEADRQDPAKLAARRFDIEQRVYDQLKGNLAVFASIYGGGPGQPQTDFFATADQALFAANANYIVSWIAPSGGNVTERIVQEADPRRAAEDLYLTVLSRMPTEAEVTDVTNYLAARSSDRAAAAQELVWGLIASVEFRFNH